MVVSREPSQQLRPHIIDPGLVRTEHRLIQKVSNAFSNNSDLIFFFFFLAKLKPRCALVPSSSPNSYNKTLSHFLLTPLRRTLSVPPLFSFLSFLWHNLMIYRHHSFQKHHFSSPYHRSYLKRLPLNNLGLLPVLCPCDTILRCSAQYDFCHWLQGPDVNSCPCQPRERQFEVSQCLWSNAPWCSTNMMLPCVLFIHSVLP